MTTQSHIIRDDAAMQAQGADLAMQLKGGDICCLHGDLGAGKTTLTKGIAAGLGVDTIITSPTFTIMNLYPITHNDATLFVHIDTYRLEDSDQLIDIGAQDYIGETQVISIIEWPEKAMPLLTNRDLIDIHIAHRNDLGRDVTITWPE